MVGSNPALLGAKGFRFTGRDQLFKVPANVTTIWLSGVGGAGAIATPPYGQMAMRGFAFAPLAVSPGDHIRVRVGGRPEIVGRYEDGVVDFEWKLSASGGWNGGGNGGGEWGGEAYFNPGRLHACGGGGATSFHHIPAEQHPVSVVGELVAVAPGQGGTVRGSYGALGFEYRDGFAYDVVQLNPAAPFSTPGSAFSFAGEDEPGVGVTEFLGSFDDRDAIGVPLSTPQTRTWVTLNSPFLRSDGSIVFTSQDVALGNPGESFRGGHGRAFGGAGATAGGGGGYGGGASGTRLLAIGSGIDTLADPDSPYGAAVEIAQEARHGGFLLPIDRPADFDVGGEFGIDAPIASVEADGVETDVLHLSGRDDPFGIYGFTDDPPDSDYTGDDPDTMLGHGSALILWVRDRNRKPGWHVGRVGWGRNNGW